MIKSVTQLDKARSRPSSTLGILEAQMDEARRRPSSTKLKAGDRKGSKKKEIEEDEGERRRRRSATSSAGGDRSNALTTGFKMEMGRKMRLCFDSNLAFS